VFSVLFNTLCVLIVKQLKEAIQADREDVNKNGSDTRKE
jgi:hypothetical protein